MFTPILLHPNNPQNYDPRVFLVTGSLMVLAVVVLLMLLAIVLPTDDNLKRNWIFRSLHRDLRRASRDHGLRLDEDGAAFRDADHLSQLGALSPTENGNSDDELRIALYWTALASAARQARIALDQVYACPAMIKNIRRALAAEDAPSLRAAADRLGALHEVPGVDRESLCLAASRLASIASLIEQNSRGMWGPNDEFA